MPRSRVRSRGGTPSVVTEARRLTRERAEGSASPCKADRRSAAPPTRLSRLTWSFLPRRIRARRAFMQLTPRAPRHGSFAGSRPRERSGVRWPMRRTLEPRRPRADALDRAAVSVTPHARTCAYRHERLVTVTTACAGAKRPAARERVSSRKSQWIVRGTRPAKASSTTEYTS
jgi:hypothetical protein